MPTENTHNDSSPPLADDAPKGSGRRRILVVASLVVAAQLLVPASYYVSDSEADERFAWRMFSNRRAESCQVQATERRGEAPVAVSRPLRLSRVMHRAWIHGLSRSRPGIVDKFFSWRCEDPLVTQVALSRHCRSATGERMPVDTTEHRCVRAP